MTNKKLSADEIGNALMRYYNVSSIEELMETPRFKEEYARTKNAGAALMAMNKVTEENVSTSGVYIKHGLLTEWDEKTKTKVTVGEGPVVLFQNGRTKMFAKKGETNSIDGEECATWVQIEGVTRKFSVAENKSDFVFENASIAGPAVPEEFPSVPITDYLKSKFYCMSMDDNRGIIRGQTSSKSVVFMTGTIIPDEDLESGTNIRVNTNPEYHKEPHVKVRVQDSDGNVVSTKIPFDQVLNTFGLSDDAHFTDVKEAVGGQPVALQGVLSFVHPAGEREFEPNGTEPGDYHQLMDAINELDNLDYFIEEDYKGEKVKKLCLKGKKSADGKPIQFIRIAGIRVYDLQQVWNKKDERFEWQAQAHHEDLQRDPWFSAVEKSGTFTTQKGEVREWFYAPGAYIKFLNNMGGKVSLPDDNPFAQLANQSALFQYDEEPTDVDASAEAEAEVATETPTGVQLG